MDPVVDAAPHPTRVLAQPEMPAQLEAQAPRLHSQPMRLINPVRRYAWGSTSVLPRLLDEPEDGQPWAELWLGGHPDSPSTVCLPGGARSRLDDLLLSTPSLLGARHREFAGRLPFMTKVLAVGRPLSLQVHPDGDRAERGRAAEHRRGLSADHPAALYRDGYGKPEMLCALTDFEALVGFRSAADAAAVLRDLAAADTTSTLLQPWIDVAETDGAAAAFAGLLRLPTTRRQGVHELVRAARRVGTVSDPAARRVLHTLLDAFEADLGVVAALLLTPVSLRPGQAVAVPAGCPHAYLSGTGVEIMGCSDNSLRAGLTGKPVDIEEMLSLVRPDARGVVVEPSVHANEGGTCHTFPMTGAPFLLGRWVVRGSVVLSSAEPKLLLCTQGRLAVQCRGGDPLPLATGQAVFIPAGSAPVHLSGLGVAFDGSPGPAH